MSQRSTDPDWFSFSPGRLPWPRLSLLSHQGTSVTAGHDNFFNQSYPVVWGNLMTKYDTHSYLSDGQIDLIDP